MLDEKIVLAVILTLVFIGAVISSPDHSENTLISKSNANINYSDVKLIEQNGTFSYVFVDKINCSGTVQP